MDVQVRILKAVATSQAALGSGDECGGGVMGGGMTVTEMVRGQSQSRLAGMGVSLDKSGHPLAVWNRCLNPKP